MVDDLPVDANEPRLGEAQARDVDGGGIECGNWRRLGSLVRDSVIRARRMRARKLAMYMRDEGLGEDVIRRVLGQNVPQQGVTKQRRER